MHANRELCEYGFTGGEEKQYFNTHINTYARKGTHIHVARGRLIVERRIVMRQSFVIF